MMENEPMTMDGKICLVTGATLGIGYATALGLAKKGADVILVGHHQGRGEETQEKINQQAGREAAQFYCADLSSMAAIGELAGKVKSDYTRLDVLVNNAGTIFLQRKESVDGYEMTFALNHLNYFKLTLCLLDLILASAPARIINVSSNSHINAEIHFDDLQMTRGYRFMEAYGRSKLANLLFTYELDRRLKGKDVTVNALHPGFVSSHMGKQYRLARPFISVLHFLFGKSPEEGAETSIYLATSQEGGEKSGLYYVDTKPASSAPVSYDEEAARRLWEISRTLSGVAKCEDPAIKELVD